jgi:hypothetical protein
LPNRIIKESIRTSKTVNAMTDFQFRMWVYLITYVDDYGRGSADPELLKGFVFPRRKRVSESDIQKTLAELAGMGCISLYDVDGESYFCFPRWSDHQRIQTKKSRFPSPDDENSRWVTVDHGESPPESKSEYEYKSESNTLSSESEARAHEGWTKVESTFEKPKTTRFVPPTVEEVREYCAQKGYDMDAEAFWNHYESNGWRVGKSPMKSWQAAVRNWQSREREFRPTAAKITEKPGRGVNANGTPGSYEMAALRRLHGLSEGENNGNQD